MQHSILHLLILHMKFSAKDYLIEANEYQSMSFDSRLVNASSFLLPDLDFSKG